MEYVPKVGDKVKIKEDVSKDLMMGYASKCGKKDEVYTITEVGIGDILDIEIRGYNWWKSEWVVPIPEIYFGGE